MSNEKVYTGNQTFVKCCLLESLRLILPAKNDSTKYKKLQFFPNKERKEHLRIAIVHEGEDTEVDEGEQIQVDE